MAFILDMVNNLNLQAGTPRSKAVERAFRSFNRFTHSQVIGGIVLLIAAIVAIIWANSPFAETYFHLLETELSIAVGDTILSMTVHEFLNDALMMAFFLLIGLEVKEQILVGELSSWRQAILPVGAALGGMLLPAAIYALINAGGDASNGWGIPMATDIAFALGILALLGKGVPISLKVFLASLAVADDIGAILVITFFYSGSINLWGLLIALFFWLVIFALGRLSLYNALIYFLLSIGVWAGFFIAGIHPTIAGVVVAFAIPANPLIDKQKFDDYLHRLKPEKLGEKYEVLRDHEQKETLTEFNHIMTSVAPPLAQLEHTLQPLVTFIVMPLFALANAGVPISGDPLATLTSPVSLGVALGLLIGKPLGILLFTWLMVRSGVAVLPHGLTWRHIGGASLLAGIGFTVSLFVTELAFTEQHALADGAKIGILAASFVAGVAGYLVLRGLKPVDVQQEQPLGV